MRPHDGMRASGWGWAKTLWGRCSKVLDTIADHPAQYRIVDGDVRGVLVGRFPYCVYYRVKPDRVVIIAVFHTSRDPSHWQRRK